ncbi:MAG TPA: ATP-binding protein [Solirubrobacteraceae bacterium]|nr:ATP-binding protein [Solirubrobacteraceae bacterium]
MSTRAFKNDVGSIREARRFVAAALAGAPEEVVEVAELMVSELATNCVRHAGSEFEVAINRTADGVRVEVTDPAVGEPTLRSPSPEEPTGRGLRIVEALSLDWGIERVPPGKAVWFTLDTAAASGDGAPHATETNDVDDGASIARDGDTSREAAADPTAPPAAGRGAAQRRGARHTASGYVCCSGVMAVSCWRGRRRGCPGPRRPVLL